MLNMLNIITANDGAEYLTTPGGKAVGAVLLVAAIVVAVVIFRKVLAAKARKTIAKAKDKLK